MDAPKVFVSHASDDKDRFVLGFAEKLRANGIDAWLDKWEMQPGDSLVDKIFEEGIKNAQAFIIVLSKRSVEKRWIREELNAAVVKKINGASRLIPVVIEDCDIPEALKSTLWIRVKDINNFDTELHEIVAAIYDHKSKPPLGPQPSYIQTPVDKLPGFTQVDSQVLKLIGDQAVENGLRLVNMQGVYDHATSFGISQEQATDSLRILSNRGYIRLVEALGGYIDSAHITVLGFERYANQFIPRYAEVMNAVIAQIINSDNLHDETIASALSQPKMLIDHILDKLEQRRLVKLARTLSGAQVYDISPELRRLLN